MYREIAGPTIEEIAGVEEVKVTNLPLYVTHVCLVRLTKMPKDCVNSKMYD